MRKFKQGLKRDFLLAASVAVLAIVVPSAVLAAGGGGHGGHHESSIADTIPLWKNFIVYAALTLWGISKLVGSGWPSRRERILASVEAGKRELEAAEQRLDTARAQVASLEQEQEGIQTEIAEDGEREFKRIIDEAHERANRITAQATSSVEAERKAMESAIRAELAELVVERARKRLKSEVDESADAGLRSSALGGIGQLLQ